MKLKIVLLTQYPYDLNNVRGGVESSMVGLVEELKKFDTLELHIITSTKQINKNETIIRDGIIFHYISSPKLPQLITSLTFDQQRIKRKIREINPDLLHAHMTAPLYGYTALKSGYPAIVTVHGIVKEEAKSWQGLMGFIKRKIFIPMERYVLEHAKLLTVVSPYVEQKIKKWCKGNIFVIPNGVQEEFFEIEDKEVENRLLFVGGIEPRKSMLNLLKAVNIVKNEIPSVKLHIVGGIRKKKYFYSLIEYIEKNNLSKYVIFRGALSKEGLKKEFSECSVFVFPSKEESQGIVLLEAMAAGKPVVATNVGGIPYIVENGVTGSLVEHGDVEGLAREISNLLANKDLRKKYAGNGINKAKLYSHKIIAQKYYELYFSGGIYEDKILP